jgi:hypothetical protein
VSGIVKLGSPSLIKQAIKAHLLDGAFDAALSFVNGELGDGLETPPLRSVKTAELKVLAAELPAAEVLLVQSRPVSPDSPVYDHIIAIRFYVGGDNEETITAQCERYVLGARQLYNFQPGREAAIFPFAAGTVSVGTEDYDPTARLKAAEATLVKVGSIELIVRTVN